MPIIHRLIREPLVHFLLIGMAIFIAYGVTTSAEPDQFDERQIAVTQEQVVQLAAGFKATWRRPPTRKELDKLIEGLVLEDILVREALALSMDKGDTVIRSRLAQKMTFLFESAAGARTATDMELKAFYDENRLDYRTSDMIAFEQVFLGERPTDEEISSTLAYLAEGIDPASQGRQSMLPPRMGPEVRVRIDGTFGRGFFDGVSELPVNEWSGPIRSGFGIHLIRVTEIQTGEVQDFDAVRSRIEGDWKEAIAEETQKEVFSELRNSYSVSLPTNDEIEKVLQ